MRNEARLIDKTFLSLDHAEERMLLHRDYAAHFFRWSHIARFLNHGHRYKDAVVLDVGCGKEFPVAKLLYTNKMSCRYYVGVDANKIEVPEMLRDKKLPIAAWSETDFCALSYEDVALSGLKDGQPCLYAPNVLVCCEVFEHVKAEHGRRMLQHMQKLTTLDCTYFLSTPCYNGSAAQNHISETTFNAFGSLVEDLGFAVDGVWGTFASIRDYKEQLSNWTYYYAGDAPNDRGEGGKFRTCNLLPLFEVLHEYYDSNALATIFAPLFPASSRNCLWQLSRATPEYRRRFCSLVDAPTPWTQGADWRDLAGGELPKAEQPAMAAEMTGKLAW